MDWGGELIEDGGTCNSVTMLDRELFSFCFFVVVL